MKHLFPLITGFMLIISITAGFGGTTVTYQNTDRETLSKGDVINLVSSPEYFDLARAWIKEFNSKNPSAIIVLRSGNTDLQDPANPIFIVGDEGSEEFSGSSGWVIGIGHDAIVPVINAKNPMIEKIKSQGFTVEDFRKILISGVTWAELVSGGMDQAIKAAVVSDPDLIKKIADFSEVPAESMNIKTTSGAEAFIEAVRKDIYAIGFCHLSDIKTAGTDEFVSEIVLLPVDRNRNGRIDSFENIYNTPGELARGLWIGKYPRSLAGNIFAAARVKPTDAEELAFLSWILTSGGESLTAEGFSDIAGIERQSGMAALSIEGIAIRPESGRTASFLWLIILMFLLAGAVLVFLAMGMLKRINPVKTENIFRTAVPFNAALIDAPGGVFFDKTHTWVYMEKDGLIRFGIDDFIQHVTGEITSIMMKEPGTAVRRGETLLTIIREGKRLNLYAPVSGTIKAQNTNLYIDSSIINASPYGEGWIYLIEPRNWFREIQLMFMADTYKMWLEDEFTRLKIFFTETMKPGSLYSPVPVMQDGGELTDNILADLGPEAWEEFQTGFIDTSK